MGEPTKTDVVSIVSPDSPLDRGPCCLEVAGKEGQLLKLSIHHNQGSGTARKIAFITNKYIKIGEIAFTSGGRGAILLLRELVPPPPSFPALYRSSNAHQ